jgi:hypothetical protein
VRGRLLMSFAETLLAGAVGGFVTGVLAIAGVLLGSRQASQVAVDSDKRRDASLEAADVRHDASEQQRWIQEKRLAAYSAFLAETDPQGDDQSTLGVATVARQASAAFAHVKLLASADVDRAASAFFNRYMDFAGVSAQSPPADEAVLLASAQAYSDAYRGLLHAMRRELGVEP